MNKLISVLVDGIVGTIYFSGVISQRIVKIWNFFSVIRILREINLEKILMRPQKGHFAVFRRSEFAFLCSTIKKLCII